MAEGSGANRLRVDYFYDAQIGNFHYGEGHPMRPHRVRLTHHLMVNYGLYKHMNIFRPKLASKADMNAFHSDEYIRFLNDITPENMSDCLSQLERFNLGADCPVFDGLYEYCQTYTGGSISGAARINQGCSDVVLNWAGGMHHAKKGEVRAHLCIHSPAHKRDTPTPRRWPEGSRTPAALPQPHPTRAYPTLAEGQLRDRAAPSAIPSLFGVLCNFLLRFRSHPVCRRLPPLRPRAFATPTTLCLRSSSC